MERKGVGLYSSPARSACLSILQKMLGFDDNLPAAQHNLLEPDHGADSSEGPEARTARLLPKHRITQSRGLAPPCPKCAAGAHTDTFSSESLNHLAITEPLSTQEKWASWHI